MFPNTIEWYRNAFTCRNLNINAPFITWYSSAWHIAFAVLHDVGKTEAHVSWNWDPTVMSIISNEFWSAVWILYLNQSVLYRFFNLDPVQSRTFYCNFRIHPRCVHRNVTLRELVLSIGTLIPKPRNHFDNMAASLERVKLVSLHRFQLRLGGNNLV